MNKQDFNEGLLGFLDASPTPFHATENMSLMLQNAGFQELKEDEAWQLEKGQKYYVTRNGASIIAFTYPKNSNYTIIGSHTDSPTLKLKPNPVIKEHGVVKFGVEPYGGLLLNPWFDRDLSLAGKVAYLDTQDQIQETLINVQKPIAIIPSLAIHLDRKANEERSINQQTDISPILSSNEDFNMDEFLEWQLSKHNIHDVKSLYASELSFYATQKASFVGLRDDFIAAPKLDNLLSCYVSLVTICSVDANEPMLLVASDHEEVGSESTSGAAGSFLENTLKRMYPNYDEYMKMIRTSILISTDNAHAIHPNYPDKHDQNHSPLINKGAVIKINSNQRYASNTTTISKFMNIAQKVGEPYQQYVTRSDMGCGSTIGPITASRLGIETLDVGLPTFAMHSIRELAGSDDAYSLYKILVHFQS
jgi:aspartyl aminopeptidase